MTATTKMATRTNDPIGVLQSIEPSEGPDNRICGGIYMAKKRSTHGNGNGQGHGNGHWRMFRKGLKGRAERLATEPRKLASLLASASRKADARRGLIGAAIEDLRLLFRMLRAWTGGKFRLPMQTVVAAIGAVVYFLIPLDAVPDIVLALGFLDDAAVVAFVVSMIRKDLDAFRAWEGTSDPATQSQ